jgi:hypothetical protein
MSPQKPREPPNVPPMFLTPEGLTGKLVDFCGLDLILACLAGYEGQDHPHSLFRLWPALPWGQ